MKNFISKISLNTIEEAIESVKRGEIIIVVDDEDRESAWAQNRQEILKWFQSPDLYPLGHQCITKRSVL